MGRPSNLEVWMREKFRSEPMDWQALLACWRPCPAEAKKHPHYRKSCSQCPDAICKRMVELGLDEEGDPLPKSDRPGCGAKTRAGTPCQAGVVPGKRRCRLHGGLSTGPKKRKPKA